ncbi:uncharacterized protein MONBRDRAFT_26110 [Monosiga brevicollis MX1]|uniref:Cupin-like domain-containing protein n=1 Tax=Monosiga brevicollis TaxID=81824 RepID=A9V1D8_MONBE|nr:uncharacterized protein MONBRDRAFT_26110 [Monosiga brevicollis MX1]EDQ88549.1 predicted protein [Monosiga brevicollis MX1]|eukprot:XP_001746653.1 hypothetical protein [Monosiga brevicollis MX1]
MASNSADPSPRSWSAPSPAANGPAPVEPDLEREICAAFPSPVPVTFPFRTRELPRISADDQDKLMRHMQAGRPVVITNSSLCAPAARWDLAYLGKHMGSGPCHVYTGPSPTFRDFDPAKNQGGYHFDTPITSSQRTFARFIDMLRKAGGQNKFHYLQQALNDTVGARLVQDYLGFDWEWLRSIVVALKWGALNSNTLFVGPPGVHTPMHYDEYQNLFAQLQGSKQCTLVPPSQFEAMRAYRFVPSAYRLL